MSALNQYFDRIFVISLKHRGDRWSNVIEECHKHNLEVERFEAYDICDFGGKNFGCNCSHRGLLEVIAYNRWDKVLVLEDDFQFVYDDAQDRFAEAVKEVPADFDFLYLGGGYANDPKYRHSEHVMRINAMMTTSSYAVRWKTARRVAPWIQGGAGIDTLYHGFTEKENAYCLVPRLCVQRPGFSEIQQRDMDNSVSMLDPHHEARFPWPPKK